MELRGSVRTNPQAKLAAYTFILINQGYARLDILINGRARTSSNTGRVKAMHA
jgi:hypothetical protein